MQSGERNGFKVDVGMNDDLCFPDVGLHTRIVLLCSEAKKEHESKYTGCGNIQ